MRSNNLPYEPRLDHLRFFAALIVFLFHVYHFYYLNWKPHPDNAWLGLLVEGHTGVSLFFVLSGFIFMQIALHSDHLHYRRFMGNRFLRIAPLFLVIFFIAISVGRDSFKGYYLFYTLFSNLGEAPTSGTFITGAAWTISIEFTFYLIFPFIARFFKEQGYGYMLRLLTLMVLIKFASFYASERSTHMFYSTLIGRLDQFLMGMLFARIYIDYGKRLAHWAWPLLLLATAIVYANSFIQARSFSFFLENPKQFFWITWSLQESLGWALFVVAYMLMPLQIPSALDRTMCRLGEVSYSFYLLHGMVIFLVFKTLGPLHWFEREQLNALVNATILFVLVWLVAQISYHTIERPFLMMRKRYVDEQEKEPA